MMEYGSDHRTHHFILNRTWKKKLVHCKCSLSIFPCELNDLAEHSLRGDSIRAVFLRAHRTHTFVWMCLCFSCYSTLWLALFRPVCVCWPPNTILLCYSRHGSDTLVAEHAFLLIFFPLFACRSVLTRSHTPCTKRWIYANTITRNDCGPQACVIHGAQHFMEWLLLSGSAICGPHSNVIYA